MDINERLAKLEVQCESNERLLMKLEAFAEPIPRLVASVERLSEQVKGLVESIDERLKEQGQRIGDIEKKGGKKLEAVLQSVLTAMVVAAAMYFLMGQAL